MKIKIVENLNKDNDKEFESIRSPLSYRVSLKLHEDTLTIERKYFRVGFLDGEGYEKYYFDNHKLYSDSYLTYASFITKDIDNEELKCKSEIHLLNRFQEESLKCKEGIKNIIIKEMNKYNSKIKIYDNVYYLLDNYDRKRKINKILNRNGIKG